MEFAKAAALLQTFRLPQRFRSENWNLRSGRTYIFPTGFGFLFGILALIQLMMAISSQNNLIYLFVFTEISIALSSMFFTNLNILKMKISSASTENCFAQEPGWVTLKLEGMSSTSGFHLQVRWSFEKDSTAALPSASQLQIPWTPEKRGLQSFPRLAIESSYPFGLLRAWKLISLEQKILVYPCRRGQSAFPPSSAGDRSLEQHGLFHDLKVFQRGDSPQRIDWRASQRAQKLLIRRFEEEATVQLSFHWQQVASLAQFEDRVSQLALWVDLSEKQGASYSLSLGSWHSGHSRGPLHWNLCMEQLARLNPGDLP